MSTLVESPLKHRVCVEWRAEVEDRRGATIHSEALLFQNVKYRLQFVYDLSEACALRLMLVEGVGGGPFVVTVLVEKVISFDRAFQVLARERLSELPWDCGFDGYFLRPPGAIEDAPNERRTVRFVIIFEEDPTSDNLERPVQMDVATSKGWNFPSNLESLSLDLANLLKKQTLPDVKLKCGGGEIPAHRSVLAARSEVFAAMFRNDTAESRSGNVDVPDVDDDVIDPFLQYVYSGKIPSGVPDEVVPGLYAAADKYAVLALQETCRDRMVSRLTEDNCVIFLALADAHGDVGFKKSVIDYICTHEAAIRGDALLDFGKKQPQLAIEVYQSIVDRQNMRSGTSPHQAV